MTEMDRRGKGMEGGWEEGERRPELDRVPVLRPLLMVLGCGGVGCEEQNIEAV